ncbi:MAG: sulfotransferase domain-containing protein [Pseudomonadota bacterium]
MPQLSDVHLARRLSLVTGPPRSGTTAIGEMLGLADGTSVLHEPMNPEGGDASVQRPFRKVGHEGYVRDQLYDLMERISALKLKMQDGIFPGDPLVKRISKKVVGGRSNHSLWRARLKPKTRHILWKDPFALFLAEDIARLDQVNTIVTYRPPHAIAASFKRLKWKLNCYKHQDGLPERYKLGASFGEDHTSNSAKSGTAFWYLSYGYLLDMAKQYKNIRFINIDRVIDDPVASYQTMFDYLGLPFSADIQKKVESEYAVSSTPKSDTPDHHTHTKNRNVQAVNTYWKSVLDEEEISYIDGTCSELMRKIEQSKVFLN